MSCIMSKRYKIAGINFDHMHMGDLLRMVHDHPDADLVGICDEDPARMQEAVHNFSILPERVFTDYQACIAQTQPDIVILCPATAGHAEWTEKIAPLGTHILMEKPFAASVADADRMIEAMEQSGNRLMINWPLRWVAAHVTAYRLLSEGVIGDLLNIHYYDGNRGPLRHGADKVENNPGPKSESWFYQKAAGGGSLLDYLGYGTTLGTWYFHGKSPVEMTCVTDEPEGLEVEEHSITIARYDTGLAKFETQWGTFTDPWIHQPQPKCGFILKGSHGTISSYDYEPSIRVQTEDCPEGKDIPADSLEPPFCNPIQYYIHCLNENIPFEGPLSLATARIGQQMVDTAVASAAQKRTLPLVEA